MRRWFAGAALGLALALSAAADDPPKTGDPPPKKDEPKTPAEELKALQKEVSVAMAAASKAYREKSAADKDDDKKGEKAKALKEAFDKALREYETARTESAAKALELARKDPKSAVALDAIVWAMQALGGKPDAMKEAFGLLREHHLENPKIRTVIRAVQYAGLPENEVTDFLNAVVEKNPDRATKATVLMALADKYKSKAEPRGRSAPKDADQWAKKAEEMFERVAKEFGDVKYGGGTFADRANGELFEMRHLAIGKVAPDIEAEDLDGVKFKLSDYRGKVVVIDFWGDW